MSRQGLKITSNGLELRAQLEDSPLARALCARLPFSAPARVWGGEVYFSAPFENAASLAAGLAVRDCVDPGDVAYWLEGRCVCLFFDKTPISTGNEIRAASDVVVLGRLRDWGELGRLREGDELVLSSQGGQQH